VATTVRGTRGHNCERPAWWQRQSTRRRTRWRHCRRPGSAAHESFRSLHEAAQGTGDVVEMCFAVQTGCSWKRQQPGVGLVGGSEGGLLAASAVHAAEKGCDGIPLDGCGASCVIVCGACGPRPLLEVQLESLSGVGLCTSRTYAVSKSCVKRCIEAQSACHSAGQVSGRVFCCFHALLFRLFCRLPQCSRPRVLGPSIAGTSRRLHTMCSTIRT
jgi:hypothetical protein